MTNPETQTFAGEITDSVCTIVRHFENLVPVLIPGTAIYNPGQNILGHPSNVDRDENGLNASGQHCTRGEGGRGKMTSCHAGVPRVLSMVEVCKGRR